MKYRFRATRAFWRSFGKLPVQEQRRARDVFIIFKQNPFDPRLRSHKIQKLFRSLWSRHLRRRNCSGSPGGFLRRERYGCHSGHRLARSVSLILC
jgi:hypothetical protein